MTSSLSLTPVLTFVKNNSPLILSVVGSIGVVTTAGLTFKATTKAERVISEYKEIHARNNEMNVEDVHLTRKETTALVWKMYVPAAVSGVTAIACILGAHVVHIRKTATLLSLYSLTDSAYKEYKEIVEKEVGEKTANKITDSLANEKVKKHPPQKELLLGLQDNDTLCHDGFTGRYFKSDAETIRAAQNDINEALLAEGYVSLNEFYGLIGLEDTDIGEELGWSNDELIRVIFTSTLTPDQKPCLSFSFQNPPKYKYYTHTGV